MKYTKGNILNSKAQSLVNTVNTVGVMGKGIALQFKEQFPHNFKVYEMACKEGEVKIGKMLVVKEETLQGAKIIINFPTKTEWFKKSSYKYIEEGLRDLVKVIEEYPIKSIAIPPLGCGNGGPKWDKVKSLMEQYLSDLKDVEIIIYEPDEAIKKVLQKETRKRSTELTDGRAMLLYALFQYEKYGEPASVFVANKLAYFLQESGENLKLKFDPYLYGPYAQAIDKVLYNLNGVYLKGMEQMKARPFETLTLNYDKYDEVEKYVRHKLNTRQRERLDNLFRAIQGFESAFSLEILASVHYLMKDKPHISTGELYKNISSWNNRKEDMLKKEYVEIAHKHLKNYGRSLNFEVS